MIHVLPASFYLIRLASSFDTSYLIISLVNLPINILSKVLKD